MSTPDAETPEPAEPTAAAAKPADAPSHEPHVAEYKDKYLRALAEIDNTKKRLERERQEFVQLAAERVLRALLPVLDTFEHALKAGAPSADGLRAIFQQLMQALEREGLKRISAVGKAFDHDYHEAVQQVEAEGVAERTVLEEVQAGYTLQGRVLRPALVKVAKQASGPTADHRLSTTEPEGSSGGQ